MGHDVFKKKEKEALYLKTDSFVVESNVHYPTDYNLLWDSARKCVDVLKKIITKHISLKGWRKLGYWYKQLKIKVREISLSTKKSEEKRKEIVTEYLSVVRHYKKKKKRMN